MSRAGDFLNEADFDSKDWALLRNRMKSDPEIVGSSLKKLADACDVFGQYAEVLDRLIENLDIDQLDDLILLIRNKAAFLIEICDHVEDTIAEDHQSG